jgi:hypothetical protein
VIETLLPNTPRTPVCVSIAPAKLDEHCYRSPMCHEMIDSRDLDAVAPHLEPISCTRTARP